MILRVEHAGHFTAVRNKTLRDSRLSFKARGLLAYLLSLPDGSSVGYRALEEASPDGQFAIRSALNELVLAGYIQRRRFQGKQGTWFAENVVREQPMTEAETTRFPRRGFPRIRTKTKEGGGSSPSAATPQKSLMLLASDGTVHEWEIGT